MAPPGRARMIEKSLRELREATRTHGLGRAVLGLLARRASEDHPIGGMVGDVMTRNVATCTGGDSLHRAAQLMWDRDCGAIPIVDAEGRAVGLVTDRDLCMAAYTRSRPLAAIPVSSLLSGQLFTCSSLNSIDEAVERMRTQRIRRLVVVEGKQQRVVGMLSLADVARYLSSLAAVEPRAPLLLAELLASLSSRRLPAERAAE
jgi:CBS domain-containing protein